MHLKFMMGPPASTEVTTVLTSFLTQQIFRNLLIYKTCFPSCHLPSTYIDAAKQRVALKLFLLLSNVHRQMITVIRTCCFYYNFLTNWFAVCKVNPGQSCYLVLHGYFRPIILCSTNETDCRYFESRESLLRIVDKV